MLKWLLPTRDCKFERVVKTTAHSTVRVKVGNRYSDQDSARLQKTIRGRSAIPKTWDGF
jgi:hypothetical protein